MSFSATGLLLASLFYLIVLFGIAWGTERGVLGPILLIACAWRGTICV